MSAPIPTEACLLRIHVGEADRFKGHPLHEAIVLQARESGLAGATVLRGAMGYGATSRLHTSKILRLASDLPLVIEIIDAPERIEAFLPVLEDMLHNGGLATVESVRVVAQGRR